MNIKTNLVAKKLVRGARTIRGICLHDTCGNGGHGDTLYLVNDPERRGVSIDFTVERDGTIYQLNDDLQNKFASHCGRSTKWREFRNRQCNKALLGIEILQKAKIVDEPPYPQVQVEAVAELCFYLCQKFSLSKEDITTHAAIIQDGTRSDPRRFPFPQFWRKFNALADVSKQPLAGAISHTVKKSETLYSIAKAYQTTVEQIKALNNFADSSNTIQPGQLLVIKQ